VKAAGIKTADLKTTGLKTIRVAGDDLRLALVRDSAGKDEPQSMSGAGHTRIEQRLPDGTVQTSSGDALQAKFEAAKSGTGVEIASAEQTGNVQIRSVPGKAGEQPSEGAAESAALDGASDVLTLTTLQRASSSGTPVGHPRFRRGDTSVSAGTIRLMQATGDAVAEGSVAATFQSVNAKPGAPVTHALAQRATLRKAAQTVEFTGTDAAPARMWQGASQVEAANLLLDREHDSMQAWPAASSGFVIAVFAEEKGPGSRAQGPEDQGARGSGAKGEKVGGFELKGDKVMRVTSKRLNYSGASHEVVFTGGVTAEGEDGQVRAQRGVAFLTPKQGTGSRDQGSGPEAKGPEGQRATGPEVRAGKGQPDPVASSVEKIVMSGAVKVQQPGRVGTGEQLLYTAATREFVLTGTAANPPHLVDDKQGSITGATLLFRSPDSTIVVAGEPAARRVHTETTIKK
jgi:lipopolysaccharide export system protein LptA